MSKMFGCSLPSMIPFPFSYENKSRAIIFRNTSNFKLCIRLVPSSEELIRTNKVVFLLGRLMKERVKIRLNGEALKKLNILENEKTGHTLKICCIIIDGRDKTEIRKWIAQMGIPNSDMEFRLQLNRYKSFTPFETIFDIPGDINLIYPIPTPRYPTNSYRFDVFSYPAHRIESDTKTAHCLNLNEEMAILPANSIVETARDINFDDNNFQCWLFRLFGRLFSNEPIENDNDLMSAKQDSTQKEIIRNGKTVLNTKKDFNKRINSPVNLPCGAATDGSIGIVH